MQDLIKTIKDNTESLKKTIRKRYDVSVQRAEAEYRYRSSLGKEMAVAKLDGMAATSLYDYCRGLEHIAKLRCDRDILQAQEDYLTEMIYYYRTEIRISEGMMSAERRGV